MAKKLNPYSSKIVQCETCDAQFLSVTRKLEHPTQCSDCRDVTINNTES